MCCLVCIDVYVIKAAGIMALSTQRSLGWYFLSRYFCWLISLKSKMKTLFLAHYVGHQRIHQNQYMLNKVLKTGLFDGSCFYRCLEINFFLFILSPGYCTALLTAFRLAPVDQNTSWPSFLWFHKSEKMVKNRVLCVF